MAWSPGTSWLAQLGGLESAWLAGLAGIIGFWQRGRQPVGRAFLGDFARWVVPIIFGLTVLVLWEGLVAALNVVPPVILPPPSAIAGKDRSGRTHPLAPTSRRPS